MTLRDQTASTLWSTALNHQGVLENCFSSTLNVYTLPNKIKISCIIELILEHSGYVAWKLEKDNQNKSVVKTF